LILATVTPDNTPGGANLTFAFPIGLFIVIGVILYLWLGRPHRRVPAGLPVAAGGSGGAESAAEPAGGIKKAGSNEASAAATDTEGPAAADTGAGGSAPDTGTGNVSGQEPAPGTADPERGTTDGTEASE
jgi:hypothetical protein